MTSPNCPAAHDAEDLADMLDREQRAHEQSRQALVDASRELDRLRTVEVVARGVLRVCDTPTEVTQTEERLRQLDAALSNLRTALAGKEMAPTVETIANLIMVASMRAGGEGRDFNAYEAAALVEAWILGRAGQPSVFASQEAASRYRAWLAQWTQGRVAEREGQLRAAAEPFLQLARDRLARRSWEPIPDADCRRLLEAFDIVVSEVDRG